MTMKTTLFTTLTLIAWLFVGSANAQNTPQGTGNFPQGAQLAIEGALASPPASPVESNSGMSTIGSLQSGLWNDPETWDCTCIPESLDDVIIADGHTITLNIDASITNMTIAATGALQLESESIHQLILSGDWDNSGSFVAELGTVVFNSTTNQNIIGASTFYQLRLEGSQEVHVIQDVVIKKLLTIVGSALFPNSQLTLAGNGTETASIDNIENGTINGDLIVEKTLNPTRNGWLTVSAPSNNSTIQDWNDDFVTTGFSGSDYPTYSFISMQYYDETNGETPFVGIDSTEQAAVPGLGYYIYANSGSYTFETLGQPIIGNHIMPVTYTPSGNMLEDGVNVMGNPYACDINWDSPDGWVKQNINGAIYVWDVSQNQFRAYNNGYGINGGSALIKNCEAFWVQANADNPSLAINENAKVVDFVPNVNTSDDFLRMSMVGSTTDEFVVAFNEDAVADYETTYDALKFYSDSDVPNISTQSNDLTNLSINALPLGEGNLNIPVMLHAPLGGDFILYRHEFPTMETMACIAIEDLETSIVYDLAEVDSIAFTTEPVEEEIRFMIHVGGTISATHADVLCHGDLSGEITATGTGTGPWNYTWFDETMTEIAASMDETGSMTLYNLGSGNYTVTVENNDFCSSLSKLVAISEPGSLYWVGEEMTHVECNEVSTGEITVTASGGVGALSYDWSTGGNDSTITLLTAGDYSVVVTDENGCLLAAEYTITSAPNVVALFEADNQVVELDNGEATVEFSNISINATDFEWAFGDGSAHSFDENPTHTYTEAGVYIVMMNAWNDDCSASYQIVVQVQEIVTSIEVTTFTEGIDFHFQEDHLLISFDLPTAMNLEINGYNLLGQRMLDPMIGKYSTEQIELQLTQRVSVGIITVYNRDTGEAKSFKIIH
jgi:PKD repeat protein